MTAPLVSIVLATYNRSNILGLSIDSVRRSTYPHWELLVIGDACTDDTARVVAAYDDARIQFHNLTSNVGDQSGPNNEGVRRSTGDVIAYLNHDDLWFPDHLQRALDALEQTGADLVSNLVCTIDEHDRPGLLGLPAPHAPEPFHWTPASAWVVRRSAVEAVGEWRHYRQCYAIPSQDWQFRAWRRGCRLVVNPEMTVIGIVSGRRRLAYARRESAINRRYAERLQRPADLRRQLLTELAVRASAEVRYPRLRQVATRWMKSALVRALFAVGLNPNAIQLVARYGRRGGYIDALRRRRGLARWRAPR